MAQRSATRLVTRAVDVPSDGLIRLVAPALALILGMMAMSFIADDRPSPWTNLLSTATEWKGSQPSLSASAAGAASRQLDRDGASRANDDGYLEGFHKVLAR
jgi:lipopolysaccharide export LptBFGC system permease protein LptF